ncbi:DNA ligase D [Candidatus Microgenomates bacterium]|nr:MAG: DNA ligase D [Candidatus Microgenomates bacterium]
MKGLGKYIQKRKFNKTPEPIGRIEESKGDLEFVVQKHYASHLHYDFRLELNGVLKSWAVPKGPSLNPADKRLAILVEDHPLDYLAFEGTIPEGNYGAGTVMIWDIGTYNIPKVKDREENEKILSLEFKKGHLDFILNGKKLKGEFSLTRFKKEENKEYWLLVKKKDEDPMPHNIKPMLATLIDKPFNSNEWVFEIKWDGYRAIAEINKEENIELYSRNNQSFNEKYFPIVQSLREIKNGVIFDGEIVVLDDNGKPVFQMLQDYQKEHRGNLVYYIFDILYLEGKDLRNETLIKRKEILKKILPPLINVKISEYIENEGTAFFNAVKKQELEGIIAKKKESLYKSGRRSTDWLKIKTLLRQEALIAGFTKPRGGRKYFGALVLAVYENNELIYIGHAGGGFDEKTISDVYNKLKPLISQNSPFKNPPKTNTPVTWLKPELVCEVKFSQWTKDMHMRQPVFIGLREDKDAKEVHLEKPVPSNKITEEKENPKKSEDKKTVIIDNKTLELTNLNKVFWPKEGYTKKDLINYYEKISSFILPYLKDRPESLHRFPNGIEGESFFQKNVDSLFPKWIKTINIYSESEKKEIKYLLCQDKATLIYLANLGCIEINPWNSRTKNLNKPDYLVIDLDPEDISFDYVTKTAKTARNVLEKIGIKSYCKTSGARGMHIYIPLEAKYTYSQVRSFAKILVTIIHQNIPDFTSILRNPKDRQGKVYLDYLQNNKAQTLAAPYCIRPKQGAPVSTPLSWEEVKKGLNPQNFTIKTVFQRLDKIGDIFKPVLGKGIDMEKILRRIDLIKL